TINVAGSVASDGSLTLTGSKPSATPFDKSGDVDVQRMVVKPSASSGLSGTLGYSARYTAVQNPETSLVTRTGDIVSASRTADVPVNSQLPFQGHWLGRIVIRSCTDELFSCAPGDFGSFDLTLTQSGNVVSGVYNGTPVTGTVSGQTLSI